MAKPKAYQNEVKEKVSTEAQEVTLVKMVNDEGKEANVHPLEVENYKVGNWKVKE